MLENITYQKELLLIMLSSSIGKTFMTKELIQIKGDKKKLEN